MQALMMKQAIMLLAFVTVTAVHGAAAPQCAANRTGQVLAFYDACGGLGSGCNNMKNTKCADAPWVNYCCAAGSVCNRKTEFYWKCDVQSTPPVPCKNYTGPACATKAPLYGACGGLGSNCTGCQCRDAPWPGVCCPSNATCNRQSQYYYKCVPNPVPVKNITCKPQPVKTLQPYGACGGLGSDCDPCQCADAPWKYVKCPAGFVCNRKTQWYYKCEAV